MASSWPAPGLQVETGWMGKAELRARLREEGAWERHGKQEGARQLELDVWGGGAGQWKAQGAPSSPLTHGGFLGPAPAWGGGELPGVHSLAEKPQVRRREEAFLTSRGPCCFLAFPRNSQEALRL